MAVKFLFGQKVVWGTKLLGKILLGKILSWSPKKSHDITEFKDEDDETFEVLFRDPKWEGALEVLADPDAECPESGEKFTIGARDFYVIDATPTYKSNDALKFIVNLKRWEAAEGA